MFFDRPWWTEPTTSYSPQLTSYEVTTDVVKALAKQGFPENYPKAITLARSWLFLTFNSWTVITLI